MKKKAITYLLIIIVIFGGIFFYAHNRREKPIIVKTAVAVKGDVKAYLSTTGTIASKNVNNYYGIQAKAIKVNVKVGDKVKSGEALVVYDTSDLSNALKQAQLQYSNAVLQRDDLKNQNTAINSKINDLNRQINELERSTNLGDKTQAEALKQQKNSLAPVSKEKMELADNSVSMAKLALDSAKQKLSNNKGIIYANTSGVVTAVNVTEGTMSMGNGLQPAVEVQDLDNLKASISLGKYDANKIALGEPVLIYNGDKTYNGRISKIDPIATKAIPQGGGDATLNVEADILEKAPNLKIDFDADIDILTGEVHNVVKVPAECLKVVKDDVNYVYVLDGNTVHERLVKVGLRSDTEVEIQDGIKTGETVILNPSASMAEGVRAKEENNAGGK